MQERHYIVAVVHLESGLKYFQFPLQIQDLNHFYAYRGYCLRIIIIQLAYCALWLFVKRTCTVCEMLVYCFAYI